MNVAAVSVILAVLTVSAAPVSAQDGVCTTQERDDYYQAVLRAVTAAWRVPYEDRSLACTVLIKQNFRGEVLDIGIARCGDDPRVHKSVVDAGYLASPIPLPVNKACFSRDIILRIESRAQDHD